jgi:predicted DNA-binding transcriptional regulator YafY
MSKDKIKQDRTARLLRLQMILCQNPQGLELKEISRLFSTSLRTAYRDMKALESELQVPVWEDGHKRGINNDYFLPPLKFNLSEAMNLLLAARVLNNYFHEYHPSIVSVLYQLSSISPPALKNKIHETIQSIEKLPRIERKLNNFNKITQAWLSQNSVTVSYQDIFVDKPEERVIDPYLIEPIIRGRTIYLIGYCHLLKTIHTFNVDCIVGDVRIEKETFEIPDDFNADDFLLTSWRAYGYEETITAKMHFNKTISKYVALTNQHPSQKLEFLKDGSVNLTLQVKNTHDFRAWILGWGDDVEILEPGILRKQIADISKFTAKIYSDEIIQQTTPRKINSGNRIINGEKSSELSNDQLKLILPLLPPQPKVGRPHQDDKRILNGILWVIANKARWADLPKKYGAPSTCHSRFQTWQKNGLWSKIWNILCSSQG